MSKATNYPIDGLTTVKNAAAFLDVHHLTVYRWVKEGRIGSVKIGRAVRIPWAELRRLGTA